MTGQLTNKQINDVNKLIVSFNKQYDTAVSNGWSFSDSGIDRIQPVANAPEAKKSEVAMPTAVGPYKVYFVRRGGREDYYAQFNTLEEAKAAARKARKEFWSHIEGVMVRDNHGDYYPWGF